MLSSMLLLYAIVYKIKEALLIPNPPSAFSNPLQNPPLLSCYKHKVEGQLYGKVDPF